MKRNLPETCFCVSVMDGKVIRLIRDTKGYFPTIYSGDKAEQIAEELNAKLGVSKAQAAAMYHGSMFGWDTPGANPENYDENGCPRPAHTTSAEGTGNDAFQITAMIHVDRAALLGATADTGADAVEEAINQELGCLNDSGMHVVSWEFHEDTVTATAEEPAKIYTHDEAAGIIELFEDLLSDHGIKVPSPEDDEREEDNDAAFYGSVYSELLDQVEDILIRMLERGRNAEIVSHEFSGTY